MVSKDINPSFTGGMRASSPLGEHLHSTDMQLLSESKVLDVS